MVRITNGSMELTVTRGAFKTFYEPEGFIILEHEEDTPRLGGINTQPESEDAFEDEENTENEDSEAEDEEEDIDYSEIPLSELSFEQLCDYADQLEIDHDGVRSKKELRILIRNHLSD